MVFAILFGLSMDYEVFLVSRMHEEWLKSRDNEYAVRHGLAATAKTITAAAAIMVLVFASFILGGERVIKLFGLGLASAVLPGRLDRARHDRARPHAALRQVQLVAAGVAGSHPAAVVGRAARRA